MDYLIISLPVIAGAISGYLSDFTYYQNIKKPSWAPSKNLFAPIWTFLYILLGIALLRIYKQKNNLVLLFYLLALVTNLLWSPLHKYGNKVSITLLVLTVLFTLITFILDKEIRLLLLPVLLWTTFATYLELSIISLNKNK